MNTRDKKLRFFGGTDLDGKRLTWSGVIAGLITFVAIFLTLSLISFTIGLTTFNPLSENPLKHVGTGVTIWTVLALLISMGLAGFVSGLVANKAGFLHGFMTWALGVILIAFLVTNTISDTAKIAGNAASTIGGGVKEGTSTLVTKTGEKVEDLVQSASSKVEEVDTGNLRKETENILRDTEVKELQPEYLRNELQKSKDDIENVAKNIVVKPENYKEELNALTHKLTERGDNVASAVDKDSISNAVSKNTDLTKEESEQAVDNIYKEYQKASDEFRTSMENASKEIDKIATNVEQKTEDIKQDVDKASDTAGKSAAYLFVGLLIAMFVTSYAGVLGVEYLRR